MIRGRSLRFVYAVKTLRSNCLRVWLEGHPPTLNHCKWCVQACCPASRSDFFCGNDTVAAAMRFVMRMARFLGSVFGRTDFLRIFSFGLLDFFADFVARFFLLILWKKCPEKSSRKFPGKSSKIYTTKTPDTFLQRGRANNLFLIAETPCDFGCD